MKGPHRDPARPRVIAAAGLIDTWRARIRHRRRLARLDEHLLRDIGATRSWRDAEIRKPFWQA